MALDPSISLAVRPPQFDIQIPQPLQQFGQVLSLRGLMTDQSMRALQLQQLQQQIQEQQNIAKLYAGTYSGAPAVPAQPVSPVPTPPVTQPSLFSAPSGTGIAGVPVQSTVAGVPQDAFWRPETTDASAYTPPVTEAPAQPVTPLTAPAQPQFPTLGQLARAAPTTFMSVAKQMTDAQIAQANLAEKQLAVQQAQTNRRNSLMQGIVDEPTKLQQIATGYNEGLIDQPTRDRLLQLPWNDPQWKTFQQQALTADQAITQARADNEEKRKQWLFPYQLSDAQQGSIQKTLATQNDQRSNDASMLYAAASRGPQALDAALSSLPGDRRFPFLGVTAEKPQDILIRGLKPSEAQTASETIRQHAITNLIDAGKFSLDKQKNDALFGPGTAESWAATVYQNPDAESTVPADVRSATMQAFTKKYGLPWPKALTGQASTQETSSRTTLDAVNTIRQMLQNPEIAKNIGPIMGNLGNIEQATGAAVGLSPEAARQAQQLRTQMRFLLANEVGSLRARLSKGTMDALSQSSPRTNMDIDMLKGALDGVEGNTITTLDNLDRQRFGGKFRPRDVRGIGAAIPQAAKDALIKAGPGRHQLSDGSWWLVQPGQDPQPIAEPADAKQK